MKIYSGFYPESPDNQKAMSLLLKGDYAFNFWLGEFLLGVVLPFVLLVISRGIKLSLLVVASISSLVGMFYMIYDLVVVGQLVPVFSQYNFIDFPEYWSYSPSLHEFMLFVGAISLIVAAFIAWELFYKIRHIH
jgi:molybdopterin-containing oxidoreductase family membrane subunit